MELGESAHLSIDLPVYQKKVPSLAYDWSVTDFQRKLFKTRLALIAVALAVVGLAMGLHNLIR